MRTVNYQSSCFYHVIFMIIILQSCFTINKVFHAKNLSVTSSVLCKNTCCEVKYFDVKYFH